MQATNIRSFAIDIPASQIGDLHARLAMTRFPEKETVDDWDQGIPLSYVRDLAEYWRSHYDWRRCETQLNAVPQFVAGIDGLEIYFIHVRSRKSRCPPDHHDPWLARQRAGIYECDRTAFA